MSNISFFWEKSFVSSNTGKENIFSINKLSGQNTNQNDNNLLESPNLIKKNVKFRYLG